MKKMPFVIIAFLSLVYESKSQQDLISDEMLLSGYEKLWDAGMDTTSNWWAITCPFTEKFRLTVNGEESDVYDAISRPVFSPDGNRWAAFGNTNGSITLITESEVIDLQGANQFGEMVYSANSEVLVFSYFEGTNEIIVSRDREIEVRNRVGKLFTNYNGSKVAFMGARGKSVVLNINGKETSMYDDIKPLGFWHTGEFIYAASYGRWEIYKGEETLGETYNNVMEMEINIMGDVAAFLVGGYDSRGYCILLSDEYYEPLISERYDNVKGLDLHPYLALTAFKGKYMNNWYIVYSSTEYYAGIGCGDPQFSADGNDLTYLYQTNLDSYYSCNGVKGYFPYGSDILDPIAHATDSETYAYSNGEMLIMRYSTNRKFVGSNFVDRTTQARYNRFEKRYECLGIIRDRLYMLAIDVPDIY
jgi:hypothetical protein